MIPITVRAMSRYLAYRNAPRLAAYLARPVDDVVTRLRPAPRSAPVYPGRVPPSRTPEQNRQPGTRARDAVAIPTRPSPPLRPGGVQ